MAATKEHIAYLAAQGLRIVSSEMYGNCEVFDTECIDDDEDNAHGMIISQSKGEEEPALDKTKDRVAKRVKKLKS